MYYLFKEKDTLPGAYYNLPEGEKIVIRAFFEYDIEKRYRTNEEIERQRNFKKMRRR